MALTEHADDLCVVLCMRRLGTRGCYCWKFVLALLHGVRTTCVGNENWNQISYTPKLYALLFWIWSQGFLWFVWELAKWTQLWQLYLWAKILEDKEKSPTFIKCMNANGEILLIHKVLELLPQQLGICCNCCCLMWFQCFWSRSSREKMPRWKFQCIKDSWADWGGGKGEVQVYLAYAHKTNMACEIHISVLFWSFQLTSKSY